MPWQQVHRFQCPTAARSTDNVSHLVSERHYYPRRSEQEQESGHADCQGQVSVIRELIE
jgi:hypothetical protein